MLYFNTNLVATLYAKKSTLSSLLKTHWELRIDRSNCAHFGARGLQEGVVTRSGVSCGVRYVTAQNTS